MPFGSLGRKWRQLVLVMLLQIRSSSIRTDSALFHRCKSGVTPLGLISSLCNQESRNGALTTIAQLATKLKRWQLFESRGWWFLVCVLARWSLWWVESRSSPSQQGSRSRLFAHSFLFYLIFVFNTWTVSDWSYAVMPWTGDQMHFILTFTLAPSYLC